MTSRRLLIQHGSGLIKTMHRGRIPIMPAMPPAVLALTAEWRVWDMLPFYRPQCLTNLGISLEGMPRFSGPKATSSSTVVATNWLSGFERPCHWFGDPLNPQIIRYQARPPTPCR